MINLSFPEEIAKAQEVQDKYRRTPKQMDELATADSIVKQWQKEQEDKFSERQTNLNYLAGAKVTLCTYEPIPDELVDDVNYYMEKLINTFEEYYSD